jgi:hypothetical protein
VRSLSKPSIKPDKTLEQINKFIKDFVLGSYHILCITSATADLDAEYQMSLGSIVFGATNDIDALSFTYNIHNITDTEYVPHATYLPCL